MRGRSWTRRAGTILIVASLMASLFAPIGAASNEVTYDGEVMLAGSNVEDGTTFQYDVDDDEHVDDFEVEFEGQLNEREMSNSGSTSGSSTESISTGGNIDPDDAELTLSKTGPAWDDDEDSDEYAADQDVTEYYDEDVGSEFDSSVTWAKVEVAGDSLVDYPLTYMYDVYVASGDVGDDVFDEGEAVGDVEYSDGGTGDWEYDDADGDVDFDGSDGMTVGLKDTGSSEHNGNIAKITEVETEGSAGYDQEVTVDGESETVDDYGNTSLDIDPQAGESSLEFDGDSVDWHLEWISQTMSEDPTVDINDETFSHSGIVDEGESITVDIDGDAVESGTNTVEIRVSDDTIDPTGYVGLNYSHEASADYVVDYEGETWSERYEISRTWIDDRENTSVTIPFSSDRVAEIRDAEMRMNGGDWQDIKNGDMDLNGTTFEVQLGDVDEDDEIDVRATGSKVDVSGGEIEVLEPTTEGDTLDTEVEIVDHSDEFAVDVSGTTEGNWLHHTINESWSASSTSSVFHATGEQEIRAPGASSGSTARVQTLPLEVSPNAGDVAISSVNPSGDELRFESEPDGATEVDYTWHETNSGERYVLYSDTHGVVRDSATASSPVTLTGSSYDETLQIMSPSDDSGGDEIGAGSGASSSGVSGAVSQATGVSSPIMLIVVGVGLIAGMAVLTTRTDVPTWIIGIGGPLIGLISLEAIFPGTISSGISSTIVMVGSAIGDVWSEVGAPVMLIAVMVGAWLVVRWWQTREERATEPDTAVNFNLRDD